MEHHLGQQLKDFRPNPANVGAGVIIGFLMNLGGLFTLWTVYRRAWQNLDNLPLFAHKGDSWLYVVGMVLIALVLIGGGFALILSMRGLAATTVTVYEKGLVFGLGNGEFPVHWQDILSIRETHEDERLPIRSPLKFLIPPRRSKTLHIECRNEQTYEFNENSVDQLNDLISVLQSHATEHNVRWYAEGNE
jgi:hypothetical protein